VVQEVAHANAWRILRRVFPAAQLRNVGLRKRVQPKLPIVAKRQHSERREGLRHRGNTKQGFRRHRAVGFQVLNAEPSNVNESTVRDDSIDEAGNMGIESVVREDAVHFRECLRLAGFSG
jgi:hypothetical protein